MGNQPDSCSNPAPGFVCTGTGRWRTELVSRVIQAPNDVVGIAQVADFYVPFFPLRYCIILESHNLCYFPLPVWTRLKQSRTLK